MARPPELTDAQRRRLAFLEPQLREAVRDADYQGATRLTAEIQDVLRPTGHETRLMRSKNWLYEAALEAGRFQTAISGLSGVRQKVSSSTRVYLEATALLAIAQLRRGAIEKAQPFIFEALQLADTSIRSDRRRRQFRRRLVARFEEEAALAAVRGIGEELLDPGELQEAAGYLLQTRTEDELLESLGEALPQTAIQRLLQVDALAKRALPPAEVRLLPTAEDLQQKRELGRKFFAPVRRVLWRSLCDPKSDVYKAWVGEGLGAVLNKKVIGFAVVAAFADLGIGLKALAVPAAALLLKIGVEIFCEVSKPKTLMIGLDERD
jgi:hypothetical protein